MSAQEELLQKYGSPSHEYINKYCTVWEVKADFPWFPAQSFLINKDFQVKVKEAFTKLQEAGIEAEIKTFDGCYNDRDVRGSSATSLHAWAAAIDLNAACDGMVVNPTPQQREGTWSPQFITLMKDAGLFYGGDFKLRADPMHWALLDG